MAEEKEEKKTQLEDTKLFPIVAKDEKKEDDDKKEMTKPQERNLVLLFTVIGAVVGYISFLIVSPLISFAIAIVVFIVAQTSMKSILKVKAGKLLSGNALVVYFLIWLVVWTIFYNLQLIASY